MISPCVFLFKVTLIHPCYITHPLIKKERHEVYYVWYKNNIEIVNRIEKNWFYDFDIFAEVCEAYRLYKLMNPRWFTLYQFFKTKNILPLDIFSHILQYYRG